VRPKGLPERDWGRTPGAPLHRAAAFRL